MRAPDGYIRIWDPTTMRLLHTFGHGAGAYCLAFSKDNTFLVHGGGDGHAHVQDMSVDPRTVEAFARMRPNVTLSLLDDDHQLTNSLPRIWDGISAFLEMK